MPNWNSFGQTYFRTTVWNK